MITEVARGRTASGDNVLVHHDPDGFGAYGGWWVRINGSQVGVLRVDRARDGGTTVLRLSGDRKITFPRRLGVEDRTPKLDGEDVLNKLNVQIQEGMHNIFYESKVEHITDLLALAAKDLDGKDVDGAELRFTDYGTVILRAGMRNWK